MKLGYDVVVTSGELDVARQRDQVKDVIVEKVDAIVLCPCDSTAIAPVIAQADDTGIPVFTADIACLDKSVSVVSHVATDNFQGGVKAAQAMVEALDDHGEVALIGAFIIGVIQNGMNLLDVESYTQKVAFGLVILGAVALDRLKKRS